MIQYMLSNFTCNSVLQYSNISSVFSKFAGNCDVSWSKLPVISVFLVNIYRWCLCFLSKFTGDFGNSCQFTFNFTASCQNLLVISVFLVKITGNFGFSFENLSVISKYFAKIYLQFRSLLSKLSGDLYFLLKSTDNFSISCQHSIILVKMYP